MILLGSLFQVLNAHCSVRGSATELLIRERILTGNACPILPRPRDWGFAGSSQHTVSAWGRTLNGCLSERRQGKLCVFWRCVLKVFTDCGFDAKHGET